MRPCQSVILSKCKLTIILFSSQVTAVLVAKFPNVSASTIQSLGSQCVGLTVGQISSTPSSVINSALSTLSNISGWDQGQVNALIQSIISAGFNISSASSLESLGTLLGGVPSATISIIPSSQLLSLSQNPAFINNILSAPVILQKTFVQKVISVDQTEVLQNVPDALVMYIPLVLLTSLSSVDVSLINNKSWSHEQAMMLFGAVANVSDNPEDLSASILQGFTCSSLQTLPQQKAKDLVKACRPRAGRDKVLLKEAQLTCMYNYVKDDPFVSFTDVPSDMLLYYSYEKIQKENCQSYFSAVGRADFSVLSHGLDKKTILFNDAKDCLGISGVSLTSYQVEVLGNMACTLDSSYIQNSHPLMLEKLKNCGDLSDSQITAVQSLLLSGNTAYGNPSTWNEQTVEQIGILAVYFKSDLCNALSFNVRRKFFSVLRKQKIPMKKLRTFFTECNSESATVSNITAVTIADASFPFGFNSTQFDLYLDIAVLQNNLAAITEKVVDTSLQTVILNKLNQIYPSGLTDGVLQLLGSASRVATIDDISKWNITIIDTLSSLIDSNDGLWEPEKSKAVIMRYLSMGNRSLGSAEINAVGSNICTLNISVLENINAESLKEVLFPDLSSCTIEQKSALYITANTSFSNQRSNAKTYYQIMRPYLGGAPVEDIQALSTQNISMDITIFISLDPAVLKILNVSTVRDLMGVNIADLKLFENSSVVQSWVSRQNQSDLNTLNLGIINHNPCYGVDSHPLDSEFASGNVSAVLCNFSIPAYACSSVVVLSSDDLATLLTCKLPSSLNYSKGAWKLFFQNFPGPLDDVLDRFSNMTHSSIRPDPNILDAIWEVIIKDFTAAQLMNATFITEWFQMRLRPFLSSVSTDFLSSLSSKSFSCESYQAVVEALSSQESLMKEEQKQLVFTSFIFPFLSRVDLPDPGCRSNTSGSNKWLEKNLGNFSNYAPLEKLKILNANFSSVAVLGLLSSEQKAQFILQPDSGVLGNDSVFREVFSSAITSLDRNQLGSFLTVFHQTAIQVRISVVYKPGHISFRNKTRLFYAY
ncbi:mesothelin-like protein isoform X1 [Pangasianodon hypophthalmus]|uniref:mesothelin-like protein isoform X1 n=1 Tax=Pangasianodon hypophthalmus TaxID=310915 RepID=UPI00230765AA|nr:mesothelin-like protein isoform X1 [Pangasianodon hypophthalmus]